MRPKRRMASGESEIRGEMIAVAEQIMRDEGHAELTAKRLAETIGLTRQSVYYYFANMDELVVAVIRGRGGRIREWALTELAGDDPMPAIVRLNQLTTRSAMAYEINALAMRKPAVRAVVREYVEDFQRLQTDALERYFAKVGRRPDVPAEHLVTLIVSLATQVAVHAAIGVDGHDGLATAAPEILARSLDALSSPIPPVRRRSPS